MALAFDQVGLQHRAGQAIHLVQHALQSVQVIIDLTRLCLRHSAAIQIDELADPMALHDLGPPLREN